LTPLAIEVIQALGSWLMQGRWKQADINDFLLNALGALLGFIIYRVFTKQFPSIKKFLLD
jgi:glycopeptide antibiotics resistance protein